MISIGRERRISRFGSPRRHSPVRPVARSSGFQVRFARPVRPSSGNIGPDLGAVGCVGDLVRARRGGSKEAGRVRPAWVQRRAGSGEGGVKEFFGVPGSHPVRGVPRLRISWHVARKRAICGRLR